MSGVLIVLPSNAHVEARLRGDHALRSTVGLPAEGATASTFVTLARLEGDLARALLPGARLASAPVVRIALRRAVDGSASARELASAAGLSPDHLVDALDRTVGELSQAGVDPARLRAAAAKVARRREATRGILLAEVMDGLTNELARLGLVDGRSIAARLEHAIATRGSELAGAIEQALGGVRAIELHDVASLSPARLSWLEALHVWLAARGGGVTVELPTAGGDLFGTCGIDDPRELLAARLEERWAQLRDAPTLLHRGPGAGEGPFSRLAGQLFVRARATRAFDHEGSRVPAIVRAASVSIAVDAVACRVAAALRAGVAPSRVVIAMPTLDEAIVRPLRTALARLSVPTFEARGAMPASAPSIARVLHVLRCVDRGLRKEDVVDLLRMERAIPSQRRHAIAAHLEQVAGYDLVHDGDVILARLDAKDRAVVDPIVRTLVAGGAAAVTRGGALRFVVAVAELAGLSRAFERDALSVFVRGDDPEVLDGLAGDAAALRAFTTAIDDLARANELASADGVATTLAETIVELEAALEARRLVVGSRAGAVPIVRLRDRFGLDADVLFVMEAHDGALPARPSPDPLLPRGLVDALRDVDPLRAPPPRALTAAVDLLAAIDAIAGARAQVFVVERSIDDDGRAILPGAVALEIARLAPHASIHAERGRIIPSRAANVPARRPGDVALFQHRRASARLVGGGAIVGVFPGVDPAAVACAGAELSRGRAFAASAIGAGAGSDGSGGAPIALDDALRARLTARLRGGPEAPFPVTSIDALLECPFVTFAERVLGAKRNEPTQLDGGAKDAGIVAHQALLEIYRALRDGGAPQGEHETRLEAIAEVAHTIATRIIDPGGAPSPLQRLRRDKLVDQVVALTVEDHAEMLGGRRRFVDGEIAFGGVDARWPPLVLGAGTAAAVSIQGRIDRYDLAIDPDGRRVVTVIDYKSKVPEGATSEAFFQGKGVQLALYARVLASNLEPRPARVEGRFFGYKRAELGVSVGIKKETKKDARRDDALWRAQVGDAAGDVGEGAVALRVVQAFEAVRAGAVAPRRGPRCERCDQRVACRAPDVVLAETGRE